MSRYLLLFASMVLVAGCDDTKPPGGKAGDPTQEDTDEDDDGYSPSEGDCDDNDPRVSPGLPEICNEVDDNCDGLVDEGSFSWYADADADGFGDATSAPEDATCADPPEGRVNNADDCDDARADVNPHAPEACDGVDNDCDGGVDEDFPSAGVAVYADADGDGYGDEEVSQIACEPIEGTVQNAGDCDDADPGVNPEAIEICNGLDDDCDAVTDGADAATATPWYPDLDADGFGDTDAAVGACEAPEGTIAAAGDCDDTDAAVNPDASEICDGIDEDCDGEVDEDATDAPSWHADSDGDTYGLSSAPVASCAAPAGHVADGRDCDDTAAAINPGASEICDDLDNDCSGVVDDGASDATPWYADVDGDSYGAAAAITYACAAPAAHVAIDTDCDDTDGAVHPAATELCNGMDDDCDGEVDEDSAVDVATWYFDFDLDGYGDAAVTTAACDAPAYYVADATDCNDVDPSAHPGAAEYCDTTDDDCDGEVDESTALDAVNWYYDGDGDTYGVDSTAVHACTSPGGAWSPTGQDCDDAFASINPAAVEYCDGVDNNCLAGIDEATSVDASVWYEDIDDDGHGGATVTTLSCNEPAGYAAPNDDCDDADATFYPGAPEVCGNSLDEDCDGTADDGCPIYEEHCGAITASETWEAGGDGHLVTCDILVAGASSPVLTIEDGARVEFAAGTSIIVGSGSYGELNVDGGAVGVIFTSHDPAPAPGDWNGFTFSSLDRGSTLRGATIEYAGGNSYGAIYAYYNSYGAGTVTIADSVVTDSSTAGIYAYYYALIDISGTVIEDNAGSGVVLDNTSDLAATTTPSFVGNTLTGNGEYPIEVSVGSVGQLGDTSAFSGNGTDAIYIPSGTMDTTGSWRVLDVDYEVGGDIAVAGSASPVLTIEDGVTVRFNPGTGLAVGSGTYGELDVAGGAVGVTFTSTRSSPGAGDWDGITLHSYDQGSTIDGAIIGYGGANGYGNLYLYNATRGVTVTDSSFTDGSNSGLYATGSTNVAISASTFADNADYGVYLSTTSSLATSGGPTFVDNALTGNDLYPMYLPPSSLGQLDASSTFTGNTTDLVYVTSGTVSATASWQNLDVDYRVAGDVSIIGSTAPVVTVEDGAVLRFAGAAGLIIGYSNYGSLVVDGATTGVTFTSALSPATAGDWDGISFYRYDRGSSLVGATVAYGGANTYGNVFVRVATDVVLEDCVLRDSSTSGLYAESGAVLEISGTTFTDNAEDGAYLDDDVELVTTGGPTFVDNILTNNAAYPLQIAAAYVSQLDESSAFTGNGTDEIVVFGDTIATSATWQALDAPLRIAGDVAVSGSASPTLTIEAGSTLLFGSGTGITAGYPSYGGVRAVGTAAAPILFSSAQTVPDVGDWDGISFRSYDIGSTLSYVTVEYGGANGYGNLYFYASSASTTVSNSASTDASTWGVYRTSATPTLTSVTYARNTLGDLH